MNDVEIPPPLDQVVGYLLRRAHGLFVAHWQLAFGRDDFPITPVQGGMLAVIRARAGITQAALARALNVDRATLIQSIDRLDALGLIRREPRPEDRRTQALRLTPRGEEALDHVMAFLAERDDALLAGLDADERRTLRSLLTKLVIAGDREVKAAQKTPAPRAANRN